MQALILLACWVQAAPLTITYPNLNGNGAANLGYRVLALALSKTGESFALHLHAPPVNDERARAMLLDGSIDITDFAAGAEFERKFAAIYFPIDQGLLGLRLPIVRQDSLAGFMQIGNLADLRHFTAGQGVGWTSIRIMSNAGLPVATAPTLDALFPMLSRGRFDYLPLGFNEVYGFVDQYRKVAPNLTVDPHLALTFPIARLFYVRRDRTDLRDLILKGLENAYDDGSFHALIMGDPSVRAALAAAHLEHRVVIKIDNALATPDFLAIPQKYFYQP